MCIINLYFFPPRFTKTQVWPRKAERSQCVLNFPSCDRREVAPLTITNNDDTDLDSLITHHLQHSSNWNSQWDPWQTSSEEKKKNLGHCKNSWSVRQKERTEKETILTSRIWEIQGSEQQHLEVHEKGKRKLNRTTVWWDGSNSQEEQQQEGTPTREKLDHCETRKATTVQDRWGKCLTEEREILNRWTEYCTELYNHKANGDPSVLDCPQTDTENDHPILRKEVEAAVQSLKKGKVSWSRQHPSRTGPSR